MEQDRSEVLKKGAPAAWVMPAMHALDSTKAPVEGFDRIDGPAAEHEHRRGDNPDYGGPAA